MAFVLAIGPALVPPKTHAAEASFVSIASQFYTSFALDSEGFIWAWGNNHGGQYGNGSTDDVQTPVRIEVLEHGQPVTFRQVAPGLDHSLALDQDGQVWTTGNNDQGQLGNGNVGNTSSWTRLAITDGDATVSFIQIAAGRSVSYALDDRGQVWGWGFRLIESLYTPTYTPIKLSLLDQGSQLAFRSIDANEELAVGVDVNNRLWQIGIFGHRQQFSLMDNATIASFGKAVAGNGYGNGGFLGIGLEDDGDLWLWGTNDEGQLGDGGADPQTRWTPEKMTLLDEGAPVAISQVSGGNHYVLALDTNGNLWAWGKNNEGQLGNGTATGKGPYKVTVTEAGHPVQFASVAAGQGTSYAIDTAGRIWAWGYPYGSTPRRFPVGVSPDLMLEASQPSSTYLETITLTASISGGWGTPNGTVEFRDGDTALGSKTLSNGKAELDLSALAVGSRSLTISYSGDTTYAAAISQPLTHTVYLPEKPTMTLTPSTTGDTFDPVTVAVEVHIEGAGNTLDRLRWLAGNRSVADFADAGADIAGSRSFEAASNGIYTVYARDAAGSETVKTIELTNILEAGDAAALLDALADAAQALADHPEGDDVGEAPASARATLQGALDAAQAVADSAAQRTQQQLDSARSALEAATASFRAAIVGLVLTAPVDGLYGAGSTLSFTLTYRDAVTVSGMPRLAITLDDGSAVETVDALYSGSVGESGTVLRFVYEVPAGLSGPGGIRLASRLSLPEGAAIAYSDSGEPALTTYTVPDTSRVRIASVAPSLAFATGGSGTSVEITVTASSHGSEAGNALTRLRWLPGNRALADFEEETSGEDILTSRKFTVRDNGEYTVYAEDTAGNAAVRTVTISSIVRPVNPPPVYPWPGPEEEPEESSEPSAQSYELQLASGGALLAIKWTEEDLSSMVHELDGRSLASGPAPVTLTVPRATVVALHADSMLHVRTVLGDYRLPAALLQGLVDDQDYSEVKVTLAPATVAQLRTLRAAAAALGAEVYGPSLELRISVVHDGSERDLTDWGHAVSVTTPQPAMPDQTQRFMARYEPEQRDFSFVPAAPGERDWTWQSRASGLYTTLAHDERYADMEGSWAADAVHRLGSLLIMKGIDSDRFAPQASITRAELTALIVRALGLPTATAGQAGFADVDGSRWYAASLAIAAREGLVQGDASGDFHPDAPVTRQEAAALMVRGLRWAGIAADPGASDVLDTFADAHRIAPWARSSVADAVSAGLLQGDPAGRLRPQGDITRAEAAVMLVRLLEQTNAL